jgi:uncharacterized protein YyaL (SSP411 family)
MSKMKQSSNRLINEKSPYLQQHAHNPVDWYPWSNEAFDKAVTEDKPIFVSIGYSTCHWCHVMEKESFEDEKVASLLNQKFVSIKVDREERPDIDSIYMKACILMTGTGGWPLTIIMTPQKQPFFAGTYLPKTTRAGMVGLIEVLTSIAENWEKNKQNLLTLAEKSTNYLAESLKTGDQKEVIDKTLLDEGFMTLLDSFDNLNGGFGIAPKFPSPHNLLFLLRYYHMKHTKHAIEMVEKTLQKMMLGGIYDHLGFGFHRYSTDSKWMVPHFEKMLYDQAMICMAYIEAYQVTRKEEYRRTAEEVLQYVLSEMVDANGGFYSAEDADTEGQEGKFYLWTKAEIMNTLGDEAELFCRIFNISEEGNYLAPTGSNESGTNILYLKKPLSELASEMHEDPELLEAAVQKTVRLLYKGRQSRSSPFKDTKILTDWNGLIIAAFAKCAQALNSQKYAEAAKKASNFILEKLRTQDGGLLHRYKDGQSAVEGMIDDYASFIWGLIETYEATFILDYLREALALQDIMIEEFWDKKDEAFFFASKRSENVLMRSKEFNDGAIPSGNSVALFNLIRLARLTGKVEYEEKAAALARTINSYSRYGNTMFLAAASLLVGPTHEIVVVGDSQSSETWNMLQSINSKFYPNKVMLFKSHNDKTIEKLVNFTGFMTTVDSKTTAYICSNFTCRHPLTDTAKVLEALDAT